MCEYTVKYNHCCTFYWEFNIRFKILARKSKCLHLGKNTQSGTFLTCIRNVLRFLLQSKRKAALKFLKLVFCKHSVYIIHLQKLHQTIKQSRRSKVEKRFIINMHNGLNSTRVSRLYVIFNPYSKSEALWKRCRGFLLLRESFTFFLFLEKVKNPFYYTFFLLFFSNLIYKMFIIISSFAEWHLGVNSNSILNKQQ